MKILKIENNNGYFRFSSDDEAWKEIDKIDKDGLMELLNIILEKEVVMDEIKEDKLSNQVHRIIYGSIYTKFKSLEENKNKFKDESEREYYDAIQKYSKS